MTPCVGEDKIAEVIITRHLSILDVLGEIGMLWWVSSTVMCIGILRAAYKMKRDGDMIPRDVGVMITAFLVSIIFFGFMMAYMTMKVEDEFVRIIGQVYTLRYPTDKLYDLSVYSYLVGSSSFFIFFMSWLYIIRDLFWNEDNDTSNL